MRPPPQGRAASAPAAAPSVASRRPAGRPAGCARAQRARGCARVAGRNKSPPRWSADTCAALCALARLEQIRRAGYKSPTPIQAQSWPVALQGRDMVAIAKTGSGKTCGFLLPGFLHCNQTRKDPRVGPTMLVIAPTRELAVQIKEEADKFGRAAGIANTCARCCCRRPAWSPPS